MNLTLDQLDALNDALYLLGKIKPSSDDYDMANRVADELRVMLEEGRASALVLDVEQPDPEVVLHGQPRPDLGLPDLLKHVLDVEDNEHLYEGGWRPQ
jgi:hypothetical protein